MALYAYVVRQDTGFAPNPWGGVCTLACCKPAVRAGAAPGDWVMGTTSVKDGAGRLVYLMRVEGALTFDEYFRAPRFQHKKPSERNPHGDNIYERTPSGFRQVESPHHRVGDMERDTSTDRVLIGWEFYYFGGKAPLIPTDLREALVYQGRGQKKHADEREIQQLLRWVRTVGRPGINGPPFHATPAFHPDEAGREGRSGKSCGVTQQCK